MILERSSSNLKKIDENSKKITLEGVFAEFGVENRNGRIYEEKEYLPHLEYLQGDIATGNLLGELDHPERFEVALSNVSHRISDLYYDQNARQIKGRIEILEGTPKGAIAKSLLNAGVPLSISSRAAGTVNEDKTVSIQQIYTYDLVAKPGFEAAQLKTINESDQARLNNLVQQLNESYTSFESEHKNLTPDLGVVNENLSIYDVSDKYPRVELREEAKAIQAYNEKQKNLVMENNQVSEESVQTWTVFFKNELSKINEKFTALENAFLEGTGNQAEFEKLKKYVDELRGIQEGSLQWQQDIAKAVNKLGDYTDTLAEKNNEHYDLTQKIVETVDFNAKTLNHTQDWTSQIAETLNTTAETVDHNADMTNTMNEWLAQVAKGVNQLNEWGEEKAKAINGMHEWTSTIAKNLNHSANWSEEMFGRAMSKDDALRLVEYIELVGDGKKDPKLKKKLDEALTSNGITGKKLDENYFPQAITSVSKVGNVHTNVDAGKDSGAKFDGKIIKQNVKSSKTSATQSNKNLPKGLKVMSDVEMHGTVGSDGEKAKKSVRVLVDASKMQHGTHKNALGKAGIATPASGDGPTSKHVASQQLALDPKGGKQHVNEFDLSSKILEKRDKLGSKLDKIVDSLEKRKAKVNETVEAFPFVSLLSESDRTNFSDLSKTDKEKVAKAIENNPTTDSDSIKNLWNTALTEGVKETPMYIAAAPEKFRKLYEDADDAMKARIEAKAEFFVLETQYQINNFWETSGIEPKNAPLNEVFTAAVKDESEEKYDDFVTQVAEQMKRFN